MQKGMKTESNFGKRSRSLGIYDDEHGLLRCKGRIGRAKIQFGTRFPLLIPSNHHVTKLIIRDAHEKVYHNGVKETLAEVRARYWIVKGRQAVKKIVKRCFICKILEGLAYHQLPVNCQTFVCLEKPSRQLEWIFVALCISNRCIREMGKCIKHT